MKDCNRQPALPVLTGLLLMLGGCASSPLQIDRYAISPDELRCDTRVLNQALAAKAKASARPDSATRLLLLSGGGSHGAWGAGFLYGLASRNDRGDPPVVVTGVSTGALQATYAFLGREGDVYDLYRSVSNASIWKARFPLFVPFSSSLRTIGPLRSLLDAEIKIDVLEDVANESGRLLCVGSVVAETGEFFAWNLSGIAAKAADAKAAGNSDEWNHWLDVYKEAIVASAAVPVMFPPVRTKSSGQLRSHVDGAVRSNVFYTSVQESIRMLRTSFAANADVPLRVEIVVNGKLGTEPSKTPKRIVGVGVRSLGLALAQLSYSSAVIAQYHAMTDDNYGGNVVFRFSYIPRDVPVPFESLDFDTDKMIRLADDGRRQGESAEPWFEHIRFETPPIGAR